MSVGQSKNIRARQGKMERWMRREKDRVEKLKERLEQRRKANLPRRPQDCAEGAAND
jgi:hypothetical protein